MQSTARFSTSLSTLVVLNRGKSLSGSGDNEKNLRARPRNETLPFQAPHQLQWSSYPAYHLRPTVHSNQISEKNARLKLNYVHP